MTSKDNRLGKRFKVLIGRFCGYEGKCYQIECGSNRLWLDFGTCGVWFDAHQVEEVKDMKTTNDSFYLVWCPIGKTSPSFRHKYKSEAVEEAKRLAKTNPGSEFFVLETKYSAIIGKCDEREYFPPNEPDGVPF